MIKNRLFLLFIPLFLLLVLSNCKKDTFTTDTSAKIEFSADTILFDTVFTTIGSTTRILKVYNRNDERINITSIYLEDGTDSEFRINVDGVPGYAHQDIEIAGNDSMFIFIEVTVNPSSEFLPFIIEDHLRFLTNGNDQKVLLNAFGQNAIFHGSLDDITVLDSTELLWDNNLPHVIYGVVAVDSAETLTILPGTQIYVHARSGLFMYKSTIEVLGEFGAEVVFQGDRLENVFSDEPGQWGIELTFEYESGFGIEQGTVSRGGLWLFESPGSTIEHAIIKNGVIGVQVDTTGTTDFALTMKNTIIENMSAVGLYAQQGSIYGINNLISNCGQSCGQFTIGGKYQMYHCTFADYWSFGNRQSPTFILNNYYIDVNQNVQIRPLVETEFVNCIMYGDQANQSDFNEFIVDMQEDGLPDYEFRSCLVDTDEPMDMPFYNSMINGPTPPFEDANNYNFDLSNQEEYMSGVSTGQPGSGSDIELIPRINNELGAYSHLD